MPKIQMQSPSDPNNWITVTGAEGTKTYCNGWLDCMEAHYPGRAARMVEGETVIREIRAREEPKVTKKPSPVEED